MYNFFKDFIKSFLGFPFFYEKRIKDPVRPDQPFVAALNYSSY
jgi:hypothetical protein